MLKGRFLYAGIGICLPNKLKKLTLINNTPTY